MLPHEHFVAQFYRLCSFGSFRKVENQAKAHQHIETTNMCQTFRTRCNRTKVTQSTFLFLAEFASGNAGFRPMLDFVQTHFMNGCWIWTFSMDFSQFFLANRLNHIFKFKDVLATSFGKLTEKSSFFIKQKQNQVHYTRKWSHFPWNMKMFISFLLFSVVVDNIKLHPGQEKLQTPFEIGIFALSCTNKQNYRSLQTYLIDRMHFSSREKPFMAWWLQL